MATSDIDGFLLITIYKYIDIPNLVMTVTVRHGKNHGP